MTATVGASPAVDMEMCYPTLGVSQPQLVPKMQNGDDQEEREFCVWRTPKGQWFSVQSGGRAGKVLNPTEGPWLSWNHLHLEGRLSCLHHTLPGWTTIDSLWLCCLARPFRKAVSFSLLKVNLPRVCQALS